MKTNKIRQIRILYTLFAGILLVCLGLFFSNVIASADGDQIVEIPQPEVYQHTFYITDLVADESVYAVAHPVAGTPEGLTASARVSEYTVEFSSNKGDYANDPRAAWILVLQWFVLFAKLAIVVLAIVVLISFYRSAKRGCVFPSRQVSLLVVVGLLVLAVSLASDTRVFLERRMAADLLQGTPWQPSMVFSIHFANIFFGLTIIFLSRIFKIGREMQEEQELTI